MINQTTEQKIVRYMVHVLLIMLGAGFMYVEQWVSGHNFGTYQALAVAINAIVFNAVEKFFVTQGIELPPGTTLVSTDNTQQVSNS